MMSKLIKVNELEYNLIKCVLGVTLLMTGIMSSEQTSSLFWSFYIILFSLIVGSYFFVVGLIRIFRGTHV